MLFDDIFSHQELIEFSEHLIQVAKVLVKKNFGPWTMGMYCDFVECNYESGEITEYWSDGKSIKRKVKFGLCYENEISAA